MLFMLVIVQPGSFSSRENIKSLSKNLYFLLTPLDDFVLSRHDVVRCVVSQGEQMSENKFVEPHGSGRQDRKQLVSIEHFRHLLIEMERPMAVLRVAIDQMEELGITELEIDGAGLADRGLVLLGSYASNVGAAITNPKKKKVIAPKAATPAVKRKIK